jgi:LysM repeat protein
MHDDLDKTLHDSLAQHARAVTRPAGEIDDVFARVDRRRSRRRSIAVIGSVAAVAVGVLGIAAVGAGGGSNAPAAGDSPSGEAYALPSGDAWACTGQIGGDDTFTYYSQCQPVPLPVADAEVCVSVAPTTIYIVDTTVPAATAPPIAVWTVTAKDSLETIASDVGSTPDAIAHFNGWDSADAMELLPGQDIMIPPKDFESPQPTSTDTLAYTVPGPSVLGYTQECWPVATAPATTYAVTADTAITATTYVGSTYDTLPPLVTSPPSTDPATVVTAVTATTAP